MISIKDIPVYAPSSTRARGSPSQTRFPFRVYAISYLEEGPSRKSMLKRDFVKKEVNEIRLHKWLTTRICQIMTRKNNIENKKKSIKSHLKIIIPGCLLSNTTLWKYYDSMFNGRDRQATSSWTSECHMIVKQVEYFSYDILLGQDGLRSHNFKVCLRTETGFWSKLWTLMNLTFTVHFSHPSYRR